MKKIVSYIVRQKIKSRALDTPDGLNQEEKMFNVQSHFHLHSSLNFKAKGKTILSISRKCVNEKKPNFYHVY